MSFLVLACGPVAFLPFHNARVGIPSGSYRAQKPPKVGNTKKNTKNFTKSPTLGWTPKIRKNCDFFFFFIFFVFPALGDFCTLYEPDGIAMQEGDLIPRENKDIGKAMPPFAMLSRQGIARY